MLNAGQTRWVVVNSGSTLEGPDDQVTLVFCWGIGAGDSRLDQLPRIRLLPALGWMPFCINLERDIVGHS